MAEYFRYDDSRALDERDRIDIVPKGSSGGGGGGAFVVNCIDTGDWSITVDKNFNEVVDAVRSGQIVVLVKDGKYAPCCVSLYEDGETGEITTAEIVTLEGSGGSTYLAPGDEPNKWNLPD